MTKKRKMNKYFRSQDQRKVKRSAERNIIARAVRYLSSRIIIIALLAAGLWYVWDQVKTDDIFAIKRIEIAGCGKTSEKRVLGQLEHLNGRNIFDVDIDQVNRSLKTNPWVKEITTIRKLPDTIRVMIREYSPVAIANITSRFYLVAKNGKILDIHNSSLSPESLPVINLAAESEDSIAEKKVTMASVMLERIRDNYPLIFESISEVLFNSNFEIGLILNNDRNLLLLDESDDGYSIMKYLGLVKEIRKDYSDGMIVDLRFKGQVVVRQFYDEF